MVKAIKRRGVTAVVKEPSKAVRTFSTIEGQGTGHTGGRFTPRTTTSPHTREGQNRIGFGKKK